jgi:putative Mg2+ transporter-C (MgtC) family protein
MHPDPAFSSIEITFVWRLVAAVVFGSLMGLDRSIVGKHAGMRTYALVSLGSCVFSIVSTLASYQLGIFPGANPLQIAASIVVGVGFIGAGLSAFKGEHSVELTTATGIWVVAAIGMACGYGLYLIATATTVLGIVIFSLISRVEHWLRVNWGTDTQ